MAEQNELIAELNRWAQTFAVNQRIAIRQKADAEVCEEACDEISLAFDNAAKALSASNARVKELEATHPALATSSVDYWQRVGKAPADAIAILERIDAVIEDWMLDDDYDQRIIAIRNALEDARKLRADAASLLEPKP